MPAIPTPVRDAFARYTSYPVLATTSQDGTPNVIYVGALKLFDGQTIVIADNYFDKTRANIEAGSPAALLFITEEREAYQLKGQISLQQSGPHFDFMKSFNPEGYPGRAAAVLTVTAVFQGAKRLS